MGENTLAKEIKIHRCQYRQMDSKTIMGREAVEEQKSW